MPGARLSALDAAMISHAPFVVPDVHLKPLAPKQVSSNTSTSEAQFSRKAWVKFHVTRLASRSTRLKMRSAAIKHGLGHLPSPYGVLKLTVIGMAAIVDD
jgi:hypothetical protein